MAGGFQDLLEDLLAPLGGVSLRKMFGGIGVFKEAIMFGLVVDDVLYLKADEATAAAFEAESCVQFVYQGMAREVAMPYWRLPDRLYDDADDFHAWAETAFAVARRTAKPKKKSAAKRARKAATPKSAARTARKTTAKSGSRRKTAPKRG